LQQNKKKAEAKGKKKMSRQNYVESGKADIADMNNTPHVPLRQIAEE
jgi:hypothetical protein